MSTQRRFFTVSEITTHIKGVLEHDPVLDRVSVSGEISNYKVYPSGHHYFSLKDAESSLRCVMFRSSAQRLRFRPENGMSVVASGSVVVYQRDGAYQLNCTSLLPTGTGDLFMAFEQLKNRLALEGLFDADHKKPIPRYPARIAVITSSAGAAVRDILRILKARWPSSEVLLLPVRVQGFEAPAEIAGAIRYANQWRLADLIITGRGGGSMEDLWAFNDEGVARAIYASQIPVISAVGHEPDFTISDFVADLRAATPSNAAELAVPDQNELRSALEDRRAHLTHSMQQLLQQHKALLHSYAQRRVLTDPADYVAMKRMDLDRVQKDLIHAAAGQVQLHRSEIARQAAALDALSPLKVLSRGYAAAFDASGAALRSIADVQPEDRIRVRLSDGSLACTVDSKEEQHG
ncbi:MAG: exodeoxyribonuclease VII large subunit [Oscillospiraceae bacterium]|nr:exodeoxyribonuclease VII large subunit [Oscillospiraceae bacterium]